MPLLKPPNYLLITKTFFAIKQTQKAIRRINCTGTTSKKELDYFQFQFNELEEASIKVGIHKQLEEESETLENAEFIKSNLVKSSIAINSGEENIVSALALVKQQLQTISKFGKHFNELFERVNSVTIELKELSKEYRHLRRRCCIR